MFYLNGELCEEISVNNRSFLYGHGVFETCVFSQKKIALYAEHISRLKKGCQRLGVSFSSEDEADLLMECEHGIQQRDSGILRISVSANSDQRGYYLPKKDRQVQRIISVHAMPSYPSEFWRTGIVLGEVDIQLSHQPALAQIKHNNRLEQVIARQQWQKEWQEAIVCDRDKSVIEATQANIFIVKNNELITPDLSLCGVQGVMRDYILNVAKSHGVHTKIMRLSITQVFEADEIFVSNSVIGIWPVRKFKESVFTDFSQTHFLLKKIQDVAFFPEF